MKVDAYGNIKATNAPKKRGGVVSSTGVFSGILSAAEADETTQTSSTSDIQATASIANLLALQEISADDVKRKKLIQQGGEMLDSLENLRRSLLLGTLSLNTLRDINRQFSIGKQAINDPRLMEIIAEIELRAAVELAKLEMAVGSK